MTGLKATCKKIFILYASAGSGHKKAAEAILRSAKALSLDAEVLDIVPFMPRWAARLYTDGYTVLISRFPALWGLFYFISETPFLKLLNVHLRRSMNTFLCSRLLMELLRIKPDLIISTQFLASEIVSYAKTSFSLKTKLVTVITDFKVHNFWISSNTDLYCCAHETTRDILMEKKVPAQKIAVTGIPLDEKFLKPSDPGMLRQKFGLNTNLPIALLATGGIGAGPIEEIVDMLKDEVQLLVVCGYNKVLFERLQKNPRENVKIFGFVDNMEELMRVSQFMITKAGGLSVAEGLALGLPMLFFLLIPGQETHNAKFVEREGAGVIARSLTEIKETVIGFKKTPALLASYKSRAQLLAKPDSCRRIIEHSLKLPA